MVPKNKRGIKYPLHIQKNIHGTKEPKVFCENEACMQFMSVCHNSGSQNELCGHLKSGSAKNSFFPEKTILHDDIIDSLSENKYILRQETIEKFKALNKLTMEKDKNPLTVFEDGNVKQGIFRKNSLQSKSFSFCSIIQPKIRYIRLWFLLEEGNMHT